MKMTGHKLMALGVVVMTAYKWQLPLLTRLSGADDPAIRHHYYAVGDTHLVMIVYFLGAALTVIGGLTAAVERYHCDPRSFTRFDWCGVSKLNFWTKRVLVFGVQFLLAPIWCQALFVNEVAIQIASKTVGYSSFLSFDTTCVMLQYTTLMTLYRIGFYITLAGVVLFVLSGRLSRPWPMTRPALQN